MSAGSFPKPNLREFRRDNPGTFVGGRVGSACQQTRPVVRRNRLRELKPRAVRRWESEVPSGFRFYRPENIGSSTARVLAVLSRFFPGCRGYTHLYTGFLPRLDSAPVPVLMWENPRAASRASALKQSPQNAKISLGEQRGKNPTPARPLSWISKPNSPFLQTPPNTVPPAPVRALAERGRKAVWTTPQMSADYRRFPVLA